MVSLRPWRWLRRGEAPGLALDPRPSLAGRGPPAGPLRVGVVGVGGALPQRVVTNDDLARIVDTDDAWIRRRTGIRTRRLLGGDEDILGLALAAARRALDDAALPPEAIGEVRVATCTWLRLPSLASQIQHGLGLRCAAAVDVGAGCAGFVYAIEDAWSRIALERSRYGRSMAALVVGVDALSRITDWTDRGTCVLLGDGAGAVVLGEVGAGGLLASATRSDGRQGDALFTEPRTGNVVRGLAPSSGHVLRMDGKRVFAAAVDAMVECVHEVLERGSRATGRTISVEDLDYVIPHQANLRILERVARRLGLAPERVYMEGIVRYGNTSAASIPLAYLDRREGPASRRGPRLEVDVAFGSGFATGALLREVP